MPSGFETIGDGIRSYWLWQYGEPEARNSFAVGLINLYRRADSENRQVMAKVWPCLAIVDRMWNAESDYGKNLFRIFGHPVP